MRQASLFGATDDAGLLEIPGFSLARDWIDAGEERALLDAIDAEPWESVFPEGAAGGGEFKRRSQQYGLGYASAPTLLERASSTPSWVRDLPPWLARIGERLVAEGHLERAPENSVINDYAPGVGIAAHRDSRSFGDRVACVSLGSDVVMDFTEGTTHRRISLDVPARSL